MDADDPWKTQTAALGAFIRAQRTMADLSLRELSVLTKVSNAYLSQVERGLHQPSVRVLGSIARALNVPFEQLLDEAGLRPPGAGARGGRPEQDARPAAEPAPGPAAEPVAEPVADSAAPAAVSTEEAILADEALSEEQRQALLGVYRSFLAQRP